MVFSVHDAVNCQEISHVVIMWGRCKQSVNDPGIGINNS